MAWLRNLELIFDSKKLTPEARFLHTLHLLANSALAIYERSHHTSYVQFCEMPIRRFSPEHDRFYKFSQLLELRQGPGGLDEYMMNFLELQTQVPDMSALDTLDIYFGGMEPTETIHLLDNRHAWTLECALEESRNFANAHRGHDVRAT